jgi:hypothetical protein
MAVEEIIQGDTEIQPEMNSWSTPPAGFALLIESGPPEYMLLIDDTHTLLIE